VILDQHERPMTVITGLKPGLGVIEDLTLVHMTLRATWATRQLRGLGTAL
jgi:hypothetical protein